jgi:CRISPR-associated protein Cas1
MDSINSMLSLAYAMLARHLTVALASVGLDPYRGFYHAPRYGRPSLALDMMEPFRPIIAGSAVLSVVNTGELCAADFVVATTGTALTTAGCGAVSSRRLSAGCPRRRPTHSSAIESACVGCCWCRLGCYHAFCWVNCRPIRTTCRVEPS